MRSQIRRTIWVEAMMIAAIGLVLGLALGAASLYFGLEISQGDMFGMRLSYEFPFGIAGILLRI
jgi:hypothetical protein